MNSKQFGMGSFALTAGLLLVGVVGGVAASYKDTVLADKPVGYWRLEDLPGAGVAEDLGPYGLSGTYITDNTGSYPKAGVPGIDTNAVNFHLYTDEFGVSQRSFIQIPYSADLNPQDGAKKQLPFSVECWARPMSTDASGYRSPVGNFGGWGDSSGWLFYQTPEVAGKSDWIWVQKGGGIWLGGGNIGKGRWDHLCAVYDGAKVSFYVNGVFRDSANDSTALANSSQALCIAARDTGYGYFDGSVDEVAVYSNALSAAQITLHYQVGSTNFRVGALPPTIVSDPSPATNYAGRVTVFIATADGTAPLSYQWYKGSTAIAGATADRLEYTPVAADNNAMFKVVVTNPYGQSQSSAVKLTVLTDLILVSNPETTSRYEGSFAAFRAGADGALPISYQWYKGATAIPGATGATLWLKNISLTDDSTTYYVRISNPYMTTNSDPATLSVTTRPVTVAKTGHARFVMADEPVAYWRLDEAAGSGSVTDAAGSFDGNLDDNSGNGTFTFAQGGGVPNDPDKSLGVTGGARAVIPYAMELNPVGPFTAEAWFKPSTLGADGSDYRSAFASMGNGVGGPIGWNLYQTPNHQWGWFIWGDNWINTGLYGRAGAIVANQWHHVVLTYDGSLFHIYNNGVEEASGAWGGYVPNRNGATVLGWRTDRDWKPFQGLIDDVAFYNKALTKTQVENHYAGSIRLTIEKVGDKVVLSWPFGTLQQSATVNGTYADVAGATSPMTNSLGSITKYHRVKIGN